MGLSNEYIIEQLRYKFKNANTQNTYIAKLEKLSEYLKVSIYEILKDPHEYYPKLKSIYTEIVTQKNIIAIILTLYRHFPVLLDKKPKSYHQWKTINASLIPPQKEKPMITLEMIGHKLEEIEDKTSLSYLLMSMIYHIPINKPDYSKLYVVRYPDTKSEYENYVYIHDDKSYLMLNKMKYKLNDKVYKDILRFLPRKYLFSYEKLNSYNVFVIRSFEKYFGIKIGINDLKNIHQIK